MRKLLVALVAAALSVGAWATDFTKVQDSFEDGFSLEEGSLWSSTTDNAAANIEVAEYASDQYTYGTPADNTAAVDGWSGSKYLNLKSKVNLTHNMVSDGSEVTVGTDAYLLDTLVKFTAVDVQEEEDVPTASEGDKFLMWLQMTTTTTEENETVTTNLMVSCGVLGADGKVTSTTNLALNAAVEVGKWTRVSVKAVTANAADTLGFVVYIDGAAVSAADSEAYAALFAASESDLTTAALPYSMTKVLFPCLMEATTLTSVAFEGIGAIDDFQLVAASDAPAFTVAPYVVSFKGVGDSDWTADAITSTGTIEKPEDPVVDGYEFKGWYAKEDCSGEALTFPYTITGDTTIYAKFEALPVAQIGTTTYSTLQDAITAAIDMESTAENPVQINIISNITMEENVSTILAGKGVEQTFIILNNEKYTVTFQTGINCGLAIDGATVTFNGAGTWKNARTSNNNPKTTFCVGEMGIKDGTTTTHVPANVTINGGTFTTPLGHLFNLAYGRITVNGGDFSVTEATGKKYCFRAEADTAEKGLNATSVVVINAGTFSTPDNGTQAPVGTTKADTDYDPYVVIRVTDDEGSMNGDVKFKGKATEICGTMRGFLGTIDSTDKITYDTAGDYMFKLDATDGYYKIAKMVAQIGTTPYASLQDAIDAAIAAESSKDAPVQIDILRDITLEQKTEEPQLTILGKGMESTYIVLNNAANTVTFHTVGKGGLVIDNATVTFEGQGTWKNDNGSENNPKTMICVGEQGITDADDTLKLAPADVTVKEGTFTTAKGHLFNVAEGRITVEGGNFSVTTATGKSCFRAEDSELKAVDAESASATLVIKGGTFEVPVESNTIAPVGTESSCTKARTYISVTGQPKFKCNDVCFTDKAKFLSMNSYFAEIDTDEEGDDTYTDSEDYKFVKGTDGYWASAKITWASVTITWDEGAVTSFDLADGDTETITTEGKDSEVSKYDVDEKVSVEIKNIQFATDYELDSANSTLSITEVTADGTLHIAAKLKYSPVSPETTKTFDSEDEAKAYAAAIIAHPTDLITAPEGMETAYTSDYAALFTATVSAAASGSGYEVVVVLSDDAKKTIQTQVDGVFAKFTNLSDLSSGDATLSITDAIPGLYYTVYSSTDVTAVTTPSESKLATSKSVELTFPTQKDSNCGFYRVGVSDVKIK